MGEACVGPGRPLPFIENYHKITLSRGRQRSNGTFSASFNQTDESNSLFSTNGNPEKDK